MMLLLQFISLVTYTINDRPSFLPITFVALKDYSKSEGPVSCLLLLIWITVASGQINQNPVVLSVRHKEFDPFQRLNMILGFWAFFLMWLSFFTYRFFQLCLNASHQLHYCLAAFTELALVKRLLDWTSFARVDCTSFARVDLLFLPVYRAPDICGVLGCINYHCKTQFYAAI